MPAKYPGGYTIIDLGGVEIDSTHQEIPGVLYSEIINSSKPVYITNFYCANITFGASTEPSYLPLITPNFGSGDKNMLLFAVPVIDEDGNLVFSDGIVITEDDEVYYYEV